jgi:two-component system, sporulation sensor kinase E
MFKQKSIYNSKERWKVGLLILLAVIVITSILYTNYLAKKLSKQEKKKVELLASVYQKLNTASENLDIGFMFEIIQSNENIPLILTDKEGNIIANRNLDSTLAINDSNYVKRTLLEMKSEKDPIKIILSDDNYNLIYYKDSYLLTQLIYFPFIQFSIIGIFMIVAYFAFSSSRRAEQNRVWVGMAKETAHQLGTPLNSLTGWIEYLREHLKPEVADKVLPEMEKDVERLVTVTERFSKIGSTPTLKEDDLLAVVKKSMDYMVARSSEKMDWQFKYDNNVDYNKSINTSLFEWVIENLLKNSLDAMDGKGKISISLSRIEEVIFIEISDSGKGIASNKFKAIFKPGYSTKQRGWGLGLSLSKRIIEEYHHGKIYVKDSLIDKGTTFRIEI